MKRDIISKQYTSYGHLAYVGNITTVSSLFDKSLSLWYRRDRQRYWWDMPISEMERYMAPVIEYAPPAPLATSYKYNVGDVVGKFTVVAQLPYLCFGDVCYAVKGRHGDINWTQEDVLPYGTWVIKSLWPTEVLGGTTAER